MRYVLKPLRLRRVGVTKTAVVVILRVCETRRSQQRPLGVSVSSLDRGGDTGDVAVCRDRLVRFRWEFYGALSRRRDALFELTEALLCIEGPVKTLVGLPLAPEHRRGHGALYDALNHGRIEAEARRRQLGPCRRRVSSDLVDQALAGGQSAEVSEKQGVLK